MREKIRRIFPPRKPLLEIVCSVINWALRISSIVWKRLSIRIYSQRIDSDISRSFLPSRDFSRDRPMLAPVLAQVSAGSRESVAIDWPWWFAFQRLEQFGWDFLVYRREWCLEESSTTSIDQLLVLTFHVGEVKKNRLNLKHEFLIVHEVLHRILSIVNRIDIYVCDRSEYVNECCMPSVYQSKVPWDSLEVSDCPFWFLLPGEYCTATGSPVLVHIDWTKQTPPGSLGRPVTRTIYKAASFD